MSSNTPQDNPGTDAWSALLQQGFLPTPAGHADKFDFGRNEDGSGSKILIGTYLGYDASGRYPRHTFQLADGERVFINGGASADRCLAPIPPGTQVAMRKVSEFRSMYGTVGSNFEVLVR